MHARGPRPPILRASILGSRSGPCFTDASQKGLDLVTRRRRGRGDVFVTYATSTWGAPAAAAGGRRIAVALHDIEPATFERCALIRDWLDDHGVDRGTLLGIPARGLHPL